MGLSTNIALRALLTSQSALETIGHNVANANTEGYSRQDLLISSSRPLNLRGLQLGHGVQADAVVRSVDELLNARIVKQTSALGRLDSQLVEMQSVEALFDEPGGDGFGGLMDDIFANLSTLSASTEDIVTRTGVVQSTDNLINRFHQVSGELSLLRRDAQDKARAIAQDINIQAERIVGLNAEIVQIESAKGTVANDLRDQRELALQKLGRRVDIQVRENVQGSVQVQIDGQLLVGARSIHPLGVETLPDGTIELSLEGGTQPVKPKGGEIAGLVAFAETFATKVSGDLDSFARALVLELNRAHTGGVPLGGGFTQLRSTNAVGDGDGDGDLADSLLRDVGLPFDVQAGELYVHVVKDSDGTLSTERIEIDPERMTVQGFMDALTDVPGITARIDNSGRISLDAASGTRFHFGRPVNTAPDPEGTFGGGRASTVGSFAGPFSLSGPATIDITGATSAFTIALDPAAFASVGEAMPEEVVAFLNADPGMATNNLQATVVGGRISIQSLGEGALESFQITGGTALSSLGLGAGTFTGQDLAVQVAMTGQFTGDANQRWTFEPMSDGVIGTTPGLEVAVRDSSGTIVATIDVGEGYSPGNPIDVGDGISVSFTVGAISSTEGDAFSAELIADSDTSDVLTAFGINAFLVGTDAASIDIREDIRRDPKRIAASSTGAEGDGGAVLDMISVQSSTVAELGGTLGEFYGSVVGSVGFDISSASNARDIESFLLSSLEQQREEVSGVNVDEELVKMIQYEQSYSAAAQYLQVVNQMTEEVLALI